MTEPTAPTPFTAEQLARTMGAVVATSVTVTRANLDDIKPAEIEDHVLLYAKRVADWIATG